MHEGLIIAASGGVKQQIKMDVLANNMANMNSAGFKSDGLTFREIYPPFDEKSNVMAGQNSIQSPNDSSANVAYVAVDDFYTDHAQGIMQKTGNSLDLGLEGEGFFQVKTPNGIRYTRNGNFRMDNQNNLVTQDGNFVLDESQQQITIDANGGQITIGKAGNITVGKGLANTEAGQISLNEFDDQKVLVKEGNGLYQLMDPEVEPNPATNITVHQGYLERSNVNSIEEMTNMITAIRAFEAYQKVIQTIDEADDQAVNSIGRVV